MYYQPSTQEKISGATMVASDSTITAGAPRSAAASVTVTATAASEITAPAASATATTAATSTTASTTTTTTAAAATARYLREAAGAVFLVKDVECSKTHVDHFLFAKNEALIGCGV